jgi:hypothetical protein
MASPCGQPHMVSPAGTAAAAEALQEAVVVACMRLWWWHACGMIVSSGTAPWKEHWEAHHELPHDNAERVDVRREEEALVLEDFRCHEEGRAHTHVVCTVRPARQPPRQSKVGDLHCHRARAQRGRQRALLLLCEARTRRRHLRTGSKHHNACMQAMHALVQKSTRERCGAHASTGTLCKVLRTLSRMFAGLRSPWQIR